MGKEIEAGSGSRGRGRGARGRGRGVRGRGSGGMARGSGGMARGRTAQLVPSQGSSSATQIGLSQNSSNIPQYPTSEYAPF